MDTLAILTVFTLLMTVCVSRVKTDRKFRLTNTAVFANVTNCTCEGDIILVECTTTAPFIIWRGDIIICHGAALHTILASSQHTQEPRKLMLCDDPVLYAVAYVRVGKFTSIVNITVTREIENRTIECVENDGVHHTVMGNYTAQIMPAIQQLDVFITQLSPDNFTVAWSLKEQNCADLLEFQINASENCGLCPSNTSSSNITCTHFSPFYTGDDCTVYVQAETCGGTVTGPWSELSVKGFNPPIVQASAYYASNTGILSKITVYIDVKESSATSALSYSVTYVELPQHKTCDSALLSASSCRKKVCTHTFDVSLSSCHLSVNIGVIVYVTNKLGSGPSLDTLYVDGVNKHATVMYDSRKNQLLCKFRNASLAEVNMCSANITDCQQSSENFHVQSVLNHEYRTIDLHNTTLKKDKDYCFTIQIQDGSVSMYVVGYFHFEGDEQENLMFLMLVIASLLLPVLGVLVYKTYIKQSVMMVFSLKDETGSLCRALCIFENHHVSIGFLNTLKQSALGEGYKAGCVQFTCSKKKQRDIENALKKEGDAKVVKDKSQESDVDDGSRYNRVIKFSLYDEEGSLRKALSVFEREHLSIGVINTLQHSTKPGHKDGYVALDCEPEISESFEKELQIICGDIHVQVMSWSEFEELSLKIKRN